MIFRYPRSLFTVSRMEDMVGWLRSHALRFCFPAAAIFLVASAVHAASAQSQVIITGVVRDSSGAAIVGAGVVLHTAHFNASIKTDSDGHFAFSPVAESSGSVRVTAPGFSPAAQEWSANSDHAELTFDLRPLGASEQVVVSATRSQVKLSDLPGSIIALSNADVAANPSLNLDDLLRQVPGFVTFRRSSSRVSNPTSQGVSLRGVGASGPSRALVLEDGVPLVDPFGGWVYWDRVPRAELASVEVVRGGASDLYGSDALGGVVQFLSRTPTAPSMSADFSYGNQNAPDLSLWAGTAAGPWDFAGAIDMARTDGYILVPTSQRGAVDTAANSQHATVDATAGYRFSPVGRAFLRGTFFDEARHNGTPIQKNSTGTAIGVAGVNSGIGDHDWISARIYGQAQGYDQTFSSIAPTRAVEHLTNMQHVPSQEVGGAAQWNHIFRSQTFVVGVDSEEVMGASDEQLFSSTTGFHFANNIAGGRQRSTGIFGEDILRIANRWTLILGARWDDWSNTHGSTVRTSLSTGTTTGTHFADRTDNAFNPRLALLRDLGEHTSVFLSGYRAFRAPTLNELYRSFQQGPVVTQSNALLRSERLTGAEAGASITGLDRRLEVRGAVFWADVVDPITNVTLSPTTRQRQNLGRTRSVGTELDSIIRVSGHFQISGGYQYTHATVVDSVPALVGLNLPEVPRHQFSWEARYWNPARLMLSLQGRYSSVQFDDDLNTLPLKQYYVTGLFLGRALHRGIEVYLAGENIFNQRYDVTLQPTQTTPLRNLGPPILARAGIRVNLPSR